MRCHRARKYISEYLDRSLDRRKAAALERHLGKCQACQELLADFRAMAEAAPRMAGPEPGEDVWLKIKDRLRAAEAAPAGLREEAPLRWAFGRTSPALRFAAAAGLALVLIASGVYVGVRLGGRGAAAYPKNSEKYTLAKLDEAEVYYKKAIKSLSEAFAAQKGMMVPQVVEMFEKNLAVIDATIQACRQSVLKEPENLQARTYLLAAYMDKVTLLDTALDSSVKSPVAVKRGQTL
jgi:hypothetical protein